jgi:hypothetical protein
MSKVALSGVSCETCAPLHPAWLVAACTRASARALPVELIVTESLPVEMPPYPIGAIEARNAAKPGVAEFDTFVDSTPSAVENACNALFAVCSELIRPDINQASPFRTIALLSAELDTL